MPFKPGNKLYQNRKGNNGGRPKAKDVEVRKAAADIAREYIEASVKPVIHTYFQLAHGRLVNKYHEGRVIGQEFEADAPTTRHFIDKLLPDEQKQENTRPIAIQVVIESAAPSQNGRNGDNGQLIVIEE